MLEFIKKPNIILAADGYKANHWQEINNNVENTYAVGVPRKPSKYSDEIVVMGIALLSSIFANARVTAEDIDEAEIEITEQGYTFNRSGWEYIARELHGVIPLRIMGVEEGRVVKPQTPVIGMVATDDNCRWLVTYYETLMQSIVWKMSTVASICRHVRKRLGYYRELTGTQDPVDYMLHNFGDRSADGPEAAIYAAIAHAALFDGSDCLQANGYIKRLYGTSTPSTSSVEATEHSVMASHSDAATKDDFPAAIMAVDRLYAAVERAANGIGIPFMSVVVDLFDSHRFVGTYLGTNNPDRKEPGANLKDRIVNSGGRLICRPDSGDPTVEPGVIGNLLVDNFGSTSNVKGYTVLAPCVGVIQGDGNRVDTFESIVKGWIASGPVKGFTLDNFCLGMGSGISHDGARDDFSWSVKSIAVQVHGRWVNQSKDPITDPTKASLSGLMRCRELSDGTLEVYDAMVRGDVYDMWNDGPGWRKYYENGWRGYRQTWDDVKRRARA
jgi:nicotinamide phosphoribosyltransferase